MTRPARAQRAPYQPTRDHIAQRWNSRRGRRAACRQRHGRGAAGPGQVDGRRHAAGARRGAPERKLDGPRRRARSARTASAATTPSPRNGKNFTVGNGNLSGADQQKIEDFLDSYRNKFGQDSLLGSGFGSGGGGGGGHH
jgi:hypothetical protein